MTTHKTIAYTVSPARDDGDIERLLELLGPVFHMPAERAPKFRAAIGDANFRLVRRGEELAGGLGLVHMGQYFGGRSVSMAGVVAVGVAPHFRARGAASALMGEMLRELHREQRCSISTLFPATVPVYRKVGYEQAGGRYKIEIDTSAIDVREQNLDMRPVRKGDSAAIEDVYRRFARRNNGLLDRGKYMWDRVRAPRGETTHGFLVHAGDDVRGYIHYAVKGGEQDEYLFVHDMAALDAQAGRRLLTFLADHRSMEERIVWPGGPMPAMFMTMREQVYRIALREQWMVRVVDVERALAERGYLPGVDAELHLDVHDDLIEANNDRFVVRIADGSATVERGGRGTVRIGVRGLAPLYTGHLSAHELIAAGMAEADDDAALRATAIFAGPPPWMGDQF